MSPLNNLIREQQTHKRFDPHEERARERREEQARQNAARRPIQNPLAGTGPRVYLNDKGEAISPREAFGKSLQRSWEKRRRTPEEKRLANTLAQAIREARQNR